MVSFLNSFYTLTRGQSSMYSPGSLCGKRSHLRTVFFWDVCVCVRCDQRGHPNHSLFVEERKGFGQLVRSSKEA